jgi:hypothetical protein
VNRPGDYSKQPRRGDTIETGRYGDVIVLAVHDRGQTLEVQSVHGYVTITRAPNGCWWRVGRTQQPSKENHD